MIYDICNVTYRSANVKIPTAWHGLHSGVSHPQLAGNAEVPVTCQSLIHGQFPGITSIFNKHVFQHLFILLVKPSAAVIDLNAKEFILVVGEVSNTLDQIDMSMLWHDVFSEQPHMNISHIYLSYDRYMTGI